MAEASSVLCVNAGRRVSELLCDLGNVLKVHVRTSGKAELLDAFWTLKSPSFRRFQTWANRSKPGSFFFFFLFF